MSLKAIEMQIALPRTLDAGKIQEQIQQRDQIMNHHATNEGHKEEARKRMAVLKQEQKEKPKFHEKEGNPDKGPYPNRHEKKNQKQENEKESHPYKGKSIDFSG